jgi:predicted aspartyl protease
MSLARSTVTVAVGLGAALALGACGDNADGFTVVGETGQAVPATFDQWVPEVAGGLDGDTSRRLLVDTGAPLTILDRDSFPSLGKDGLHDADLEAFSLEFPGYQVARWDLFGGVPGAGIPDGILGGDLVRHFALALDYHDGRAWLIDAYDPTVRPRGAETMPLDAPRTASFELAGGGRSLVTGDCAPDPTCGTVDLHATRILVQARFEAAADPVWVMVDTGASSVVVDQAFFTSLGDPTRPHFDGLQVITASGPTLAEVSRVWRLALDGGAAGADAPSVDDLPVTVLPATGIFDALSMEVDRPVVALVGGTFLRRHLAVLDYPARRLVLMRYQDQSHVPADEFVGPGFSLAASGADWLVSQVFSPSDAATQGLHIGDVVDELDGTPITGQPTDVVDALFHAHAVGETLAVGLRRQTGTETHMITIEDLLPSYGPPSP